MARSKVLGIDLGTSNSAVAITEAGEAEILKNQVGEPVTPSAVRFPPPDDDKETPYVGKPALDGKHQDPERTVTSIKRKMGDSEYSITIDGESYSPPEISAYILRSLRENASDSLGVSFDVLNEAVITVPAYFSEDQRQATRTAAEMAEFDSVRIINEPTAAAMSYGYRETSEPETILVYDLGGGTFDVSVLDVGRGTFQVRSAGGDRELGGDDWDAEVADWIAEKFRDQYGTNPLEPQPTDGPGELLARESRIYEAAKDAKEEVCASEGTTTILLPYLMEVDGEVVTDFSLDFDVATLERLTGHLIDRTIEPMMDAIDEAGYNVPDLDEVILVGGATRMPQVHKQLNEIFPFEPEKCVDPDEAVAKGAAIHGDDNDILVQEVTPLTLGIGIEGGKFKPLIDRNSTLPAEGSEIFTTSENNATQVRIDVFQGEHEIVERNRKLRQFYLGDIPPQPRGVPQIEVTFRVNREGIVTARAELLNGLSDEATSEVSIDGVTDISQEEIQEHISEVR
jgi:molecular chaperone DnaK